MLSHYSQQLLSYAVLNMNVKHTREYNYKFFITERVQQSNSQHLQPQVPPLTEANFKPLQSETTHKIRHGPQRHTAGQRQT